MTLEEVQVVLHNNVRSKLEYGLENQHEKSQANIIMQDNLYGLPNLSSTSRILVLGLRILVQPASWHLATQTGEGKPTPSVPDIGRMSQLTPLVSTSQEEAARWFCKRPYESRDLYVQLYAKLASSLVLLLSLKVGGVLLGI
jgi:hypothetical protein